VCESNNPHTLLQVFVLFMTDWGKDLRIYYFIFLQGTSFLLLFNIPQEFRKESEKSRISSAAVLA